MGLSGLRRSEKGSVPVLVALSLTVLFGFAGLAMDFGMMASCKQSMQNAVDAAALAAAGDLTAAGGGAVQSTAHTYVSVNGFDPDAEDVSMEVRAARNTVTVTLSREMKMGFSAVVPTRCLPVSASKRRVPASR